MTEQTQPTDAELMPCPFCGEAAKHSFNVSHDVARCPGRITNRPLGSIAGVRVTSNAGHSECVRCRRREPGSPDHQTQMQPPAFVGGKCPQRIAP